MRRSFLCCSVFLLLLSASGGCSDAPETAAVEAPKEAPEPPPPEEPEPAEENLPGSVEEEAVEAKAEPPKPVLRKVKAKPKVAAPAKKAPAKGPNGMRRASFDLPKSQPTSLSSAQIKAIISERLPQVRACYERELKGGSQLQGKVTAAWTINTDGSVGSVRIKKNTTGDRGLAACVRKLLSKWRFPASRTPSDIEYPFVFRTKEVWQ